MGESRTDLVRADEHAGPAAASPPDTAQAEAPPPSDFLRAETVTWGGPDEQANGGCINGILRLEVNGNRMKYEWSATHNGQPYSAAGELQRAK